MNTFLNKKSPCKTGAYLCNLLFCYIKGYTEEFIKYERREELLWNRIHFYLFWQLY